MSQLRSFFDIIELQIKKKLLSDSLPEHVEDGVRKIMYQLDNSPTGVRKAFQRMNVDQLSSVADYCKSLKSYRERTGKMRIFEVAIPGKETLFSTDREEAKAYLRKNAGDFVSSDAFANGDVELELTAFRVDLMDVKRYIPDYDFSGGLSDGLTDGIPFPSFRSETPIWDGFSEETQEHLTSQRDYIAKMLESYQQISDNSEESLRFEGLLKGHDLYLDYIKQNAIAGEFLKVYCDGLEAGDLEIASRVAREIILDMRPPEKITVYRIDGDSESHFSHYLTVSELRAAFLDAVKNETERNTGSIYLRSSKETILVEDAHSTLGMTKENFDRFLKENPERIIR